VNVQTDIELNIAAAIEYCHSPSQFPVQSSPKQHNWR